MKTRCPFLLVAKFSLILTATLGLNGCFQLEQNILLNPDNTGKAIINVSMPSPTAFLEAILKAAQDKEVTEESKKELSQMSDGMSEGFASGILAGAKGVEAWHNVRYGVTKEGKFTFEGVAYFRDFNQFQVSTSSLNEGADNMLTRFRSERSPNGSWVIRATIDDEKMDPVAEVKPASATEIESEIKELRSMWPQMRAEFEPAVKDFKQTTRIKVAGTIRAIKGWQQTSEQIALLECDTGRLLQQTTALLADDARLRKVLARGTIDSEGKFEPGRDYLRHLVFNGEQEGAIAVQPGKAHFDYEAEVARAKQLMTDELKALIELKLE